VIAVKALTKRYDEYEAVRAISFTVEKGEIFGFIGPNGAGKTTTIRILATLLDLTAGDVTVAGHSVVSEPEKVRKALGFMPDLFGVYDRITVWEYLDFFGAAYGLGRRERHAVIEQIIELTDLGELRERLCDALSKGMKQRLCLAKTLIHDPQVLVLDEPASGLDPRARIEFRALLKELRSMGKTIFLSSHILTELSDVCSSVAIMEKGRLVASGPLDSIMSRLHSRHVYELQLLDKVADARAMIEKSGLVSDLKDHDHTLRFSFDGEPPQLAALLKALTAADIPVVGLVKEKQDLEDAFMQLTRGAVQ
jgi:ABC-2 type transport system ATP-binding protein